MTTDVRRYEIEQTAYKIQREFDQGRMSRPEYEHRMSQLRERVDNYLMNGLRNQFTYDPRQDWISKERMDDMRLEERRVKAKAEKEKRKLLLLLV